MPISYNANNTVSTTKVSPYTLTKVCIYILSIYVHINSYSDNELQCYDFIIVQSYNTHILTKCVYEIHTYSPHISPISVLCVKIMFT